MIMNSVARNQKQAAPKMFNALDISMGLMTIAMLALYILS
jgi:hypothetical protein